jgi:hypothetical protein
MEGRTDDDRYPSRQPASDSAWDHHRTDHAPTGSDDQENTNRRRHVTADDHGSASHGHGERRWMGWSAAWHEATVNHVRSNRSPSEPEEAEAVGIAAR